MQVRLWLWIKPFDQFESGYPWNVDVGWRISWNSTSEAGSTVTGFCFTWYKPGWKELIGSAALESGYLSVINSEPGGERTAWGKCRSHLSLLDTVKNFIFGSGVCKHEMGYLWEKEGLGRRMDRYQETIHNITLKNSSS